MTATLSAKPSSIDTVRTVADLRRRVSDWRRAGKTIAFVPTMGALHAGHISLVEAARHLCDRVMVSIFVNPTQFGPAEDFARYPRSEDADATLLDAAGADLLYAPSVDEMYPDGFSTAVTVSGLTDGLCGPLRPGHFAGVATVVTKLLLQGLPDVALFGEKDYQQLQVIRRFVRDLDIPVAVHGCPTVRDEQGLALSSRNAYLSPDRLAVARRLNRILFEIAAHLGERPDEVDRTIARGHDRLRALGFDPIEYLEVRDAETLAPLAVLDRPARLLVAARLDGVRLIDNIPLGPVAT